MIIFAFFHVCCAHLTTEISVNTIPNSNNIKTKIHQLVNDIVDVALEAILTVFFIDKNTVIMINKNKKFIKESFSFQPKYVENKFLNLTLKFHQNNTTNESKTTSIVPKYSLFQIQNLVVVVHHLKEVIVMIGNNNAINRKTK